MHFSVTTQTCKSDEAEIASDSYTSVHMMIQTQVPLSWRLKRIFPVLTCENFCSCQRNLISFIGLAKKFVQLLVFFFLGGGVNPINASTATVKWFQLRCHYQWFFNSQSATNAGSFFKKHVRCVCVCTYCAILKKFLENCHDKDLILGLELSSVCTGIPQVLWLCHWRQASWSHWEANIEDRKGKAKMKKRKMKKQERNGKT